MYGIFNTSLFLVGQKRERRMANNSIYHETIQFGMRIAIKVVISTIE